MRACKPKVRTNHLRVLTATEARREFDLVEASFGLIGTVTGILLAVLAIVQVAMAFGWRP